MMKLKKHSGPTVRWSWGTSPMSPEDFMFFVANRVQQIQDSTSVEQWRYVETKSNLADDASRGTGVRELLKSRWITGPDFLWKNEYQWPAAMHAKVPEKTTTYPSEHDPEVKKAVSMMTVTSTPEANSVEPH